MLDIFKSLFTFWSPRAAYTDGLLFRVHTQLTVSVLLFFCLILSIRQYVMKPIICNSGDEKLNEFINSFCWTNSTYTIKRSWTDEFPAPGVGTSLNKEQQTKYSYYQWVTLCLFFQAVLFYFPKWLWSVWEGNKVQRLKNHLNSWYTSDEETLKRREYVLEYLLSNLGTHQLWAIKYFFCEVLTLTNIISQAFFMDSFLGGFFWSHGNILFQNLIQGNLQHLHEPISEVFPEVTKCTLQVSGTSSTEQNQDALCILPLNLLNKKIYGFLWFWCILLIVLTSLMLMLRLAIILNARLRLFVMRIYCHDIRFKLHTLATVVTKIKNGDWFLLYLLKKNVESDVYRDLMNEFAQRLGDRVDNSIEVERM